jgi:Mor family transcriptional regulator
METQWHAQVTSLTLRLYRSPDSYENKDKYIGVIQVELLGDNTAYLHAALKSDGESITFEEWCKVAKLLHDDYGVLYGRLERNGKEIVLDAKRLIRKLEHEKSSA